MKKCSPVEMRKNLETVERYKKSGMDFVVIAVKSEGHKNALLNQSNLVLEQILEEIELSEDKS